MTKALIFDMDGTIADLYGVDKWLDKLHASDESPYVEAKPIYEMSSLNKILRKLKKQGWAICITSWLCMNSSKEYDEKVRKAKKEWLCKHNFPFDRLSLVRYGTTKANCTRKMFDYQILIDDNEKIRNGWTLGATIDAKENIIPELEKLLIIGE